MREKGVAHMSFDNKVVEEQKAWEHYQKVEADNHHLKRQLIHKNKELIAARKTISRLNKRLKEANQHRKPPYKNKR